MGVCVVKCSMCLEFHRAFHWVKWCTGNDTVMLIWLAIMIAPREETHRDDVLMILAQIASWIIWSVFPSGWDWLLSNNNSTVCMEGGVCNLFLFPFSQLAKPSRLPGSIPYSYSSFLDDVMHAVKVWKAWSKFSWFNLLKWRAEYAWCFPTTSCFIHTDTIICIHTWESGSKSAVCKDSTLNSCNAAPGG